MADRSACDSTTTAAAAASLWLERLERTLRQDEGALLREWLQVPLHREAIVQRCRLWHGPEILAVLGKLIPIEAPKPRPHRSYRRQLLLASAIAVASVAVATLLLFRQAPWSAPALQRSARGDQVHRTAAGERREIVLCDGSTIALNAASRVLVSYGLHTRDATLLEGEASFDVANDPARPFRLRVGPRYLEADAGRFNVQRLTPETAELTVVLGEVTVLRPDRDTPKTPDQLRNGPIYSYGAATLHSLGGAAIGPSWQRTRQLASEEAQARLAWRNGMTPR